MPTTKQLNLKRSNYKLGSRDSLLLCISGMRRRGSVLSRVLICRVKEKPLVFTCQRRSRGGRSQRVCLSPPEWFLSIVQRQAVTAESWKTFVPWWCLLCCCASSWWFGWLVFLCRIAIWMFLHRRWVGPTESPSPEPRPFTSPPAVPEEPLSTLLKGDDLVCVKIKHFNTWTDCQICAQLGKLRNLSDEQCRH